MSFPIIINSTNAVVGSQNQFKINLSTIVDLSDYSVSVGSSFLYYSWYNINQSPLNNNRFQLTIPTSGASTVNTLTIPDGGYNISDLNNFLQFWFIQNGYFITTTSTGLNTYYGNFSISPTSYAVQYNSFPIPTSQPAGTTSGGMTFPIAANQHIQLTILSTNTFNQIVGYNAGTYPAIPTNTGNQTKLSDFTPNVNPVSAVQMRLSCVYNIMSANSQLLHVFTNQGSGIGGIIDATPRFQQNVPCSGFHKELTLSLYDQLGNVLNLLDKNVIIKLIFQKNNMIV